MSSPIEKFNATLGGIVGELKGAAGTRAKGRVIADAAANGSDQDLLRAASQMSTDELLALKARLER